MKIEPTQSIARSLKILIWLVALPSIVFSILFVILIADHFSSAKRRAELSKPVAYPIQLAGKPIPAQYNFVSKVSLEFEGMTSQGETQIINLRLINPTEQPVVYVVRTGSNPFHLIQTKKDGKWIDEKINWFICGNSQRQTVFINSKESRLMSVEVASDLFPVKIGMEYANGNLSEQKVWSQPFELNQIKQ